MSTVNLFLGSKGGIGKTFAAAMYAQTLVNAGFDPVCYDLDPCTQGLHSIKSLKAIPLDIIENGAIKGVLFDEMIEKIRLAAADDIFIIDSGSSSFLNFYEYLRRCNMPAILASLGHQFVFHTLICAGTALVPSCKYFEDVARDFPDFGQVVWLNPMLAIPVIGGKSFEQSSLFANNRKNIRALVQIPDFNDDMKWDIHCMWEEGMTLREYVNSPGRFLAPATRMAEVEREVARAIAAAELIPQKLKPPLPPKKGGNKSEGE